MYRFLFASLLCAVSASAGPVYLDDSFPVSTRPTLQALADDVWDLIGMLFHNQPPLDLPIYCFYEKSEAPLTTVEDDRITIRVTAGDTHYAQFAFQLAHELSHVMLDPRRSNGIVETICTALSYEVLDRLGERVTVSPQLSWLTDYAPHFAEYRIADQKSYLDTFPEEVRTMVAEQRWDELSRYLAEHRKEMEAGASRERAMQTLGAVALRSAPVDFGQFTGLAACTTPSVADRPKFTIRPLNRECVDRFADVLCRIGRGCGN
ncbi:MAG: hypothetical protein LAO79_17695 [Acidobacteriia bacterium]|nr:hypothetical protein [Terriglobia bacterium]